MFVALVMLVFVFVLVVLALDLLAVLVYALRVMVGLGRFGSLLTLDFLAVCIETFSGIVWLRRLGFLSALDLLAMNIVAFVMNRRLWFWNRFGLALDLLAIRIIAFLRILRRLVFWLLLLGRLRILWLRVGGLVLVLTRHFLAILVETLRNVMVRGRLVVGRLDILASLNGGRCDSEGKDCNNGSLSKTHVVDRCRYCEVVVRLY
jgi:hypothetical protein